MVRLVGIALEVDILSPTAEAFKPGVGKPTMCFCIAFKLRMVFNIF